MYGIYVLNSGEAVFGKADGTGPSITSHFAAIGTNNTTAPATITVNGGTYTAKAAPSESDWWSYFCAPVYAAAAGNYTINGGTFTGYHGISSRYANVRQNILLSDVAELIAKGGNHVFVDEKNGTGSTEKGRTVRSLSAENNLETIPEGYKWIESTDGLGGYILNKVWTVTFELLDGTYPGESGITAEEGRVVVEDIPDFSKFSKVKLSKDPVREHYSFDGWLLENEKVAADYEITADTTFYASWIGEEVIILISDGMGHELNRAVKPYGTTMTAAELAELITATAGLDDEKIDALCGANEGYTLDEEKLWSPALPTTDVTIERTMVYNLNWIKVHTVTFDADGVLTEQKVNDGEKPEKPEDPNGKTGYTFDGWYDGLNKYDFSKPVTSDLVLKAKWSVNQYKVIYEGIEDATLTEGTEAGLYDYGTMITLPKASKSGAVFLGWKHGDAAETYAAGYAFELPAENQTYTAQWVEAVAEVNGTTYATLQDALDAATAGDTVAVLKDIDLQDQAVITKSLTLDLNGKTINHTGEDIWNNNDSKWSLISVQGSGVTVTVTGAGTLQAKANDTFAMDVRDGAKLTIENGNYIGNIHAIYVHEGELTVNGGTYRVQQTYSATQPYDFTLNCYDASYTNGTAKITVNGGTFYKFDPQNCSAEPGGPVDETGEGYVAIKDGDNYVVAEGATVTFDTAEGEPAKIDEQRIAKGGKAEKPEDPTKEGYEFLGWNNGGAAWDFENETVERTDITLTAQWGDAVASITRDGETIIYASLAEAVEAAKAGETVTLLKDVEIEHVLVNKQIKLDLNDKEVTSDYSALFTVTRAGDLTITGNGKITGPANGADFDSNALITVDGGKLTIENGTLTATGSGSDGMYGVYVLNGGTAVFENPTITSHFAAIGTNNTTAPATIVVNGGTYTANAKPTNNEWWSYFCAPIYAAANGTYKINGGSFNGYYGISSRYVDVDQEVTLGDVTINAGSGTQVFVDEKTGSTNTPNREIRSNTNAKTVPEGYIWIGDDTNGYVLAKLYTIKFVDEDGTTELQSVETPAGQKPEYTETEPTKAATAQYTYTFDGWTPEIVEATADATYTAKYTETVNKYEISFVNDDTAETELYAVEVAYGEVPIYGGAIPTKAADEQYSYTWAGWTPELTTVTEATKYTAKYTTTGTPYTVTWIVDSFVVETKYDFDTAISKPKDPTKEGYIFTGWECDDETITTIPEKMPAKDLVFTAQWVEAVAEVNGTTYATLADALDAATAGDTVTVLKDIDLQDQAVITKSLTLDLNGKTISHTGEDIWNNNDSKWSLISVQGSGVTVTVTGAGTLQAKANDTFAMDVRDGAKLTIENGNYIGNIHAIYVHEGELTVNGGTYRVQQTYSATQPYDFTLNCYDASYTNGTAKITVNGGTFYKFDPQNCSAEPGGPVDETGEGYVAIKDGDNYVVAEGATVTFDTAEGEPAKIDEQRIAKGGKAEKPEDPTKEGYEFLGWNNGGAAWDFENETVERTDITLTAQWGDAVASITRDGETIIYASLAEAVEAAKAGETVTLLKDVEIEHVLVNKQIKLDLNDKEVTSDYSALFTVTRAGDLTITGNGKITGPANGADFDSNALITVDGGKLTIENGTLTATGSGSDGMYGVYVLNGGTAVFENPTITSHFAAIGTNNTTAPATIVVNGGTYTANAKPTNNEWWSYFCAPIYAAANGTYKINGGSFNGYYGISSRYVDVDQEVTLGDVTINAGSGTQVFVDEKTGSTNTPNREIRSNTNAKTVPEGYIWIGDDTNGYVLAKLYTIKFVDEDGTTELQSVETPAGQKPEYTETEPTKAATAQYTYTFDGWTPEIVEATADATYTAKYTETVNKYEISFVNDDTAETELYAVEVAYGEVPIYGGAIPTKAADEQYSYTWAGWTPELTTVTEATKYTAKYTTTGTPYTVTWIVDSFVVETKYDFDTAISKPKDPTKEGYIFTGWKCDDETITMIPEKMPAKDLVFTAQWVEAVAEVNGTTYATLAEAVAAAADGQTVTVLKDLTLDSRVDVNKSIAIDLNGKTIKPQTTCANGSAFNITSGTVEIKNGTLDGRDVVEDNAGNVTVKDGICLVTVRNGATLNLADGISMIVDSKNGCCVYPFAGAAVNISGGTYTNTTAEAYQYKEGFQGLTINQANVADQLIHVTGGTFSGNDPQLGDDSGTQHLNEGYVAIEQGNGSYKVVEGYIVTFDPSYTETSEDEWTVRVAKDEAVEKPEDPSMPDYVFGGWYLFTEGEEEHDLYDFAAPVNANILIYAKWTKAVAQINRDGEISYYTSIQDALDDANYYETVELLKDTEESITLEGFRPVNLNLGGHMLTVDSNTGIDVSNGASLDIFNGKLTSEKDDFIYAHNGGSIALYGGDGEETLKVVGTSSLIWTNQSGTVYIGEGAELSSTSTDYVAVFADNDSNITLDGGSIVAESNNAICAKNGATINVNKGTVKSNSTYPAGYAAYNGFISINGGKVESEGEYALVAAAGGIIEILDGELNKGVQAHENGNAHVWVHGGKIGGSVVSEDGADAVAFSDRMPVFKEYVKPENVQEGWLCTTAAGEDGYYHLVQAMLVHFMPDNGDPDVEILVPQDEKIPSDAIPEDPIKDGFAFMGWYVWNQETEEEEVYNFESTVTNNFDLNARWASTAWDLDPWQWTPGGMQVYGGEENDQKLTGAEFSYLSIQKSAGDDSIGRPEGYAWVGVQFIAPEAVTDANINRAKYRVGEGEWASFEKDGQLENGRFWMGGWMGLNETKIEELLNADIHEKTWTWEFDWDGDAADTQTFEIKVNLDNISLNDEDGNLIFQTIEGVITEYVVRFAYNDGVTNTLKIKVRPHSKISDSDMPEDPTMEGYTFEGWFIGEGEDEEYHEVEYDFDQPIDGEVYLSAHWTINTYNVSFVDEDGNTLCDTQEVEFNNNASFVEPDPVEGKTFQGWFFQNGDAEAEFDFNTPITKDTVLTGKWTDTIYHVTFHNVNGRKAMQPVLHGSTVDVQYIPTVKVSGNVCDYWFYLETVDEEEEEIEVKFDLDTKVYRDYDLYPHLAEAMKVSFVDEDGNNLHDPVTVTQGTKASEIKPDDSGLVKEYYEFDGWYMENSEGELVKYEFSEDVTIESDLVLIGKWKESLTFNIDFRRSLNLADSISIYAFIGRLPEGTELSDYTIQISKNGTVSEPQSLADFSNMSYDLTFDGIKSTYYYLTVADMAAKEMKDEALLTVFYKGEEVASHAFSIYEYCNVMIETSSSSVTKELCKATLHYGGYAQKYFGYKTEDLADSDLAPVNLENVPSQYAISGDPANFIQYISNVMQSASLEAKTFMQVFFVPSEGYTYNDFNVKVTKKDGSNYTNVKIYNWDNWLCVDIHGIAATELADDYAVTVTLKSDSTKSATWKRSVLNYAYNMQTKGTTLEMRNLVKALYEYYMAAKAMIH